MTKLKNELEVNTIRKTNTENDALHLGLTSSFDKQTLHVK